MMMELKLPLVDGYSTVHERLDEAWFRARSAPEAQGVWPDWRPVLTLCVLSELIRSPGNSFAAAEKEF